MADHVLLQDFLRRYRLQHEEAAKVTGYSLDTIRSVLYRKRALPEPMRALIEAVDAMPQDVAAAYISSRLRARRGSAPEISP